MNYLKKIISTGAIRKTPKRIIDTIVNELAYHDDMTIVEVGAGQGEITSALLSGDADINYLAFEIDEQFYKQLQTNFPTIKLFNHNALQFQEKIQSLGSVDYFISSIPLSFYKKTEIEEFCKNMSVHLKKEGKVVILFTAFWLIPILRRSLPKVKIASFLTLPPYFLAVYTKS